MKLSRISTLTYFTLSYSVLIIVKLLADIPITIGNASEKASALIHLSIPSDNFYPIGKAILLIPFLWDGPQYFIGVLFYYSIGIYFYHKICMGITNQKYRFFSLISLPLNPYLIWLIYTSQDTVFEFALLLILSYATFQQRLLVIVLAGYLLSLTRPGYWPLFLFCLIYNLLRARNKIIKRSILLTTVSAILLAPATLIVNRQLYGEATFAQESGATAYFSYNKYLYLALPTFDMDVFLSTNGHGWSEDNRTSKEYTRLAIESLKNNPKEVLLAFLEKVDAYIFDIQKVPHLPGEYFLSEDAKSIEIGNERLSWSLVLGNVLYAVHRTILILTFFFTIGAVLLLRKLSSESLSKKGTWVLVMPWILGMIPGFVFYTETRFKIVSEVLLAPFIAYFWQSVSSRSRPRDGMEHAPR